MTAVQENVLPGATTMQQKAFAGEFATSLIALAGVRVLPGIGTSAAYPASMAIIRERASQFSFSAGVLHPVWLRPMAGSRPGLQQRRGRPESSLFPNPPESH